MKRVRSSAAGPSTKPSTVDLRVVFFASVSRGRELAWAVWLGSVWVVIPLRGLWLRPEGPWWSPYFVWLCLIGAGAVVGARWRPDGD